MRTRERVGYFDFPWWRRRSRTDSRGSGNQEFAGAHPDAGSAGHSQHVASLEVPGRQDPIGTDKGNSAGGVLEERQSFLVGDENRRGREESNQLYRLLDSARLPIIQGRQDFL